MTDNNQILAKIINILDSDKNTSDNDVPQKDPANVDTAIQKLAISASEYNIRIESLNEHKSTLISNITINYLQDLVDNWGALKTRSGPLEFIHSVRMLELSEIMHGVASQHLLKLYCVLAKMRRLPSLVDTRIQYQD